MDNDDDIPWMLVAMIVIYFVSWVFKKIKGEGEDEDESRPKRTLEEVQQNRKRHLARQAQRETADHPAETLRQLFESITEEKAEEPAESFLPEAELAAPDIPTLRQTRTPPPLTPPPSAPQLSSAEKEALKKIQSKASRTAVTRKKNHLRSLRAMTRGKGLRQAVVLKEILDQPRALSPY